MSSLFHHSSGAVLEYQTYGEGPKNLICFHGFAQDTRSFQFLEGQLEGQYTIIAVRLFYHGLCSRADNVHLYLRMPEWQNIFGDFLIYMEIDRFSLLAYSMGGRFAISTFHLWEEKIDHLILAAPDGIIRRFWYQFATFPVGLRQLFHFFMTHPEPFFSFLALLEKLKVMNKSVIKFATTQLGDEKHRMLVYQTWTAFKRFRLSEKALLHRINRSPTKAIFIFGKKDRIIDPKAHASFLSGLSHSEVHILDHGHNRLMERAEEIIASALEG